MTFGGSVVPGVRIHFPHVTSLFLPVHLALALALSTSSQIQSVSIRQPSAWPFQVLLFWRGGVGQVRACSREGPN